MKQGEHGMLTMEVLPALLLICCAALLMGRALILHARWQQVEREIRATESALREVQLAWNEHGGRAAIAMRHSETGQWRVAIVPGPDWMPQHGATDVDEGQSAEQVTIWRRVPERRGGVAGWMIEQRLNGRWHERMWMGAHAVEA
jgi:hypothetical protein